MDNDEGLMRMQDWGNLALGVWLLVSTLIIHYPAIYLNAALNSYMTGVAIVVFSACAMYIPRIWEEVLNVALGLWLIVSPWMLGFSSNMNLTANALIVGLAVVLLAGWAILGDKEFIKWRHDHSILH